MLQFHITQHQLGLICPEGQLQAMSGPFQHFLVVQDRLHFLDSVETLAKVQHSREQPHLLESAKHDEFLLEHQRRTDSTSSMQKRLKRRADDGAGGYSKVGLDHIVEVRDIFEMVFCAFYDETRAEWVKDGWLGHTGVALDSI